jgi:hypothetical protein
LRSAGGLFAKPSRHACGTSRAVVRQRVRPLRSITLGSCLGACLSFASLAGAQEDNDGGGFVFGSYGRVRAASDLQGHSGRSTNIVSHGTRYDLGNYAEFELRREDHPAELELRIVATLAVGGDLFHYDATFDDAIATRNLYAEVGGAFLPELTLWAGSRMVRGDDIYLLDWWPLDNLNLLGGGLTWARDPLEFKLHGGLARPSDPFYVQEVEATAPRGFDPVIVELLDRPRAVGALKGTFWTHGRKSTRGLKLIGYGEGHHVAEGTRQVDVASYEELPPTSGAALGLQLGGYWDEPRAFANVFFRCAFGLAAYDPLSGPALIGRLPPTNDASVCQTALSANVELGAFALQAGAYFQRTRDPSADVRTGGAVDEAAIDLRPHAWIGERAGVALDLSHQVVQARTLDDVTGEVVGGTVTKVALIPFYSPYGRGTYTRPHLQLTYAASFRDEGARRLYPVLDRRSREAVEHYLAIGAEWWFDSTSY